jgi:hypothetical protein
MRSLLGRIPAGVLVVVAAAGLVVGSSSARPDLGAAGFASAKFASKRYDYQLSLNGQYVPTYARTGWTGHFPLVGQRGSGGVQGRRAARPCGCPVAGRRS